ncbi:MAG: UPF0149 family protein [Rhodospirillales bacterium]|nr:UPF0149 family protein [Rhodospirillales bacterium]MDH3914348.1 UPF0149 family protein [Rhodospirillales bacterium]
MSGTLSKELKELDDFLLSGALGDDAMVLSKLDGFFAGLVVSPALIMPSEWLPLVWGDEEPVFESQDQAQSVVDLILGHYSDVIQQLDRGKYGPVYDFDRDDTVVWETWIEGFWRAVLLRPHEWAAHGETGDEDLQRAVFVLTRLQELAATPSADLKPLEIDQELEELAPDLIPDAVETLHRARLARAKPPGAPANQNRPGVGRNDPCPCGSGKKFKKCCLN